MLYLTCTRTHTCTPMTHIRLRSNIHTYLTRPSLEDSLISQRKTHTVLLLLLLMVCALVCVSACASPSTHSLSVPLGRFLGTLWIPRLWQSTVLPRQLQGGGHASTPLPGPATSSSSSSRSGCCSVRPASDRPCPKSSSMLKNSMSLLEVPPRCHTSEEPGSLAAGSGRAAGEQVEQVTLPGSSWYSCLTGELHFNCLFLLLFCCSAVLDSSLSLSLSLTALQCEAPSLSPPPLFIQSLCAWTARH